MAAVALLAVAGLCVIAGAGLLGGVGGGILAFGIVLGLVAIDLARTEA